jgi:outer membrane murein-binding lipoprotein Lpp
VIEQQPKTLSSKWLKHRFEVNDVKAIVLTSALVLAGCASSQRMDIADLNYYQIDCSKYEEQRDFLKSQMTTSTDRLASLFNTASLVGQIASRMDGTYSQHEATRDRRYDAVAKVLLSRLNRTCIPGYQEPGVCDLATPESAACQSLR